jgi:HNH endonuclease
LSTRIDEAEFESGPINAEPVPFLAAIVRALDDVERYSELAATPERWPRLRTGERVRITGVKRRLIFERDGQCCRGCGRNVLYSEVEIDHIIPWSAWGSDWSCNLRVLCGPCNQARSNFRSWLDSDQRPLVAPQCTGCDWYPPAEDMLQAYCGQCGVIGPTWPELAL